MRHLLETTKRNNHTSSFKGIVNMRLKKNEIVLIVKLPHELAFIVECESKEICKEVLKKIYSALLIRGSLDNSQMFVHVLIIELSKNLRKMMN
jgi:isocitrate dehydrogenase kinase/phosphatase